MSAIIIHEDLDQLGQQQQSSAMTTPARPTSRPVLTTINSSHSQPNLQPITLIKPLIIPANIEEQENIVVNNQNRQGGEKRKIVDSIIESTIKKSRSTTTNNNSNNNVNNNDLPHSPMTAALYCDEELPSEFLYGNDGCFAPTLSESSFASLQKEYNDLLSRSFVLTHQSISDSAWIQEASNNLKALQNSHSIIMEENRELRLENSALKTEIRELRHQQQSLQRNDSALSTLTIEIDENDRQNEGIITDIPASEIDSNSIPTTIYFSHINRINETSRIINEKYQSQIQSIHEIYRKQLFDKDLLIEQGNLQSNKIIKSLEEKIELLENQQNSPKAKM